MKPMQLKILMLEDSDADLAMIQRVLNKSEFSCTFKVMMTGPAFVQALSDFKPDVILSDNEMPQFTGSEALVLKQQYAPGIPFILITGTVSEEFAVSIIKAGADDYLLKDRLTRLPAAIEAALKQKQTEKEKNIAAEKLQHSEEQYRTLIEQAADGIFIADPTGKYIDVNESGCKALGYSKEDILQLEIKDLVVIDSSTVPSRLGEVNSETAIIQQRNLRKKDGSFLITEISAKKLKNGNYFAIVRDLTQRIEAEEKLAQSEKRFRALVENNDGIISLTDKDRNSVFRSSSAARLTGWNNDEFNSTDIGQYVHPDDAAQLQQVGQKAIINPGVPIPVTIRAMHKKGHYIWLEGMITNMMNDPAVNGVVSNFRDVTGRKEAEQRLLKANRLYFFISQINQMIVRTTNEATLFEEVCRIAVELGQFKMAWIGMIDEQTKQVIPVKHAGERKEYFSNIKPVSLDDTPGGREPAGTALREGRYIICNDIEKDSSMQPWTEAALGKDYRSSIWLPIKKFGTVVGIFSVYASEKNFFDASEITLLEEAAGDVSFALENFEKEGLRQKAEEAVAESEKRYHTLTDAAPVGIFHTDAEGTTTYVNPKWSTISGLSLEQALGNGWLNAVHEDDKDALFKGWQNATSVAQTSFSEYRFVRPDGSIAWVIGQAIPEKNAENKTVGYVGTITDITERKIAEKQIFEEKELSDKIINSLPGIFYLSDPTPRLLRWNKELEKISGYTEAEIVAMRPISLFVPEDHVILQQGLAKSYKEGSADVEVRLLTKTGQLIPFYFTGVGIEYRGKPAVLGIGIDISERKKAEEEIKIMNERFELIAKATHDGLWDWHLETGKLWGNEVHQQFYGLTLADPVPNHEEWKSRIHPDDREKTLQLLEDAKAFGLHSYVDEYRFYTENNGWMDVYGRTLIERNNEGKPIRLVGSMMDITERKKTEALLAANEKRFRKLVENGNDAFAILNPDGRAQYVSSSVQRVLGYTEEEIYQMDLFTLVHPDNIAEVQQTMLTVMANPGVPVTSHISRVKHKDGTWRWFEDTITNLIDDPDIGGIVDNFRDVTERVKDQMALKASEEKHRDIVENITDILCTHDMEGRVLSVNLTAKKQLGYEIEDMLKMNIQDILLPQSKESFGYYIDSIKRNGFAHGLMHVRTMTGENKIWEFRNTLRDNGITPPFVYGFALDVTERINAEEKLLAQKLQLETLSNNLPGVMIYQLVRELDGTMKFTYISDGVIGLIGKTPKEVMDDPSLLYKPVLDEDIAKLIVAEQQSFINMSLFQVEVRFRTHEGDIRWLNIVSIPRKLNDGRTAWDGFHVDVTERKVKEEEIKTSEEKRRLIMNAALDAIICMDIDGNITFWNPEAEKIFGWQEDEVMGKSLSKTIIPERFRKMHDIGMENYFKTGEAPALNTLLELSAINRQNEEFPVELTVLPIKQGGEEFFCAFLRDITQRKKAAEAIKESEEKYRTLVEQASEGIFIADSTGKFIIVNSSACKLSGYSTAELATLTIYDLVHPASLASNPFRFEEMMQPQGARSERKMIRKDGSLVDIEVSAKFLSDKRFIAFIRDISERIKAEQAIKFSEEKYRSLVEQASDAIFISDKDGRFITVNPSGCKISQYSEAELSQMTIFDFFIEEDIRKNPIQFEALNRGETVRSERIMKRKDGGVNQVEITAKILNDGKLLSFVRDISERIKAQNEIIKEKNLSDSIINSLPGVFYLYNRQGKFLRWNTNFEKVSLYSADEIKQMHPLDFFDDDEKQLLSEKIGNVFVAGEDEVQANFLLKNKKKIPYYFTGIAIDYENETCLMGVGIDFSERQMAQEEIEKTTEKLRELTAHLLSVREEERKRIGREIHDELGQQLTAIKMDVSWIDKKIPEPTAVIKNKLKNIITLLDGSNQSIRRILSELRPGILDDYGLIEALEWQNTQFTANTGIPVEFASTERELKLPEPLATCIFRVYQEAFTNITRHSDASKVTASLTVAKKMITVVVEDNGKGFEAAANQGKKSFGILGMKERVLAQGGSFELSSATGKGTRMQIQLPYTKNKKIQN